MPPSTSTLPRRFWPLILVTVWVTTVVETVGTSGHSRADDAAAIAGPVALADPRHLWNRLRQRLHVRVEGQFQDEPDVLVLDPRELDPLHWSRIWFPNPVGYLLRGRPYREAVQLLDEFLGNAGETLVADPLERALLQHDLWAVFDYVNDPAWDHPLQAFGEANRYRAERYELGRRLARAIGRLALTRQEIDRLPDNYQLAVASQQFPAEFAGNRQDRAFLPPDLGDPASPWVLVGENAVNPLAIRHAAFFGGRSTFVVFLRLPGGRDQTLKYTDQLREWKPQPGEMIPPNGTAIPPQVPAGTQFALVRRMMLVDSSQNLVPTRVTESVQIRVLPDPAESPTARQAVFEFRMRPRAAAGVLAAVTADESERGDMLDLGPGHDHERLRPILASCQQCHTARGILSMNSYTGAMDNVSRQHGVRVIVASTLDTQQSATIAWKQSQYSWGLLRGWLTSDPRDAGERRTSVRRTN